MLAPKLCAIRSNPSSRHRRKHRRSLCRRSSHLPPANLAIGQCEPVLNEVGFLQRHRSHRLRQILDRRICPPSVQQHASSTHQLFFPLTSHHEISVSQLACFCLARLLRHFVLPQAQQVRK